MKYIMFEVKEPVHKKVPIIFPDELVHKLVAGALMSVLRRHGWDDICVDSAGSVSVQGALVASGESESLKIKAKDEDTLILNTYQYLHGIIDDEAPSKI